MSTSTTFTLECTIAGVTRTVEFNATAYSENLGAWSAPIAACRIGRGAKIWRTHLIAWHHEGAWAWKGHASNVNNRQVAIVGWADDFTDTTHAAKANSYGAIR